MSYQEEGQAKLRRLHVKQAIALAMQGQWREAVKANQDLIETFPKDVEAHNRLGRAYMELGEYSRAKEAYRQALDLDPYNTIAEKNLRRLSHLREATVASAGAEKLELQSFIEETGKAGVVNLSGLAPPEVLATVVAGDRVYLKVEGVNLIVENGRGYYIGQVEPRYGQRLAKLIDGGNRYTANIIRASENLVTVIIREVYQDPSQAGQLSFATKGAVDFQPYAGDRMIKRELELEEDAVEDLGYTIIDEEGEVLLDDFPVVEDKGDSVESEE